MGRGSCATSERRGREAGLFETQNWTEGRRHILAGNVRLRREIEDAFCSLKTCSGLSLFDPASFAG